LTEKRAENNYSDDEIEEILGLSAPETRLVLKEIQETIMDSPLLALGLAFTVGILVGVGVSHTRRGT
jgi:ElaB/YqjD/DUF883 family membrane-anchored ribosome-binding protein